MFRIYFNSELDRILTEKKRKNDGKKAVKTPEKKRKFLLKYLSVSRGIIGLMKLLIWTISRNINKYAVKQGTSRAVGHVC